MSGFGTYPLGASPFGHDPSVPTGPRGAYLPAAPNYDGNSQDWATDEDGRVESIHPVDNGVQMAMFVQQGELKSAPTVGNTLLQCQELGTPRQQSEVEGIVRKANPIARYLTDGSITITAIETELRTQTGALMVKLHYTNNVTGKSKSATSRT